LEDGNTVDLIEIGVANEDEDPNEGGDPNEIGGAEIAIDFAVPREERKSLVSTRISWLASLYCLTPPKELCLVMAIIRCSSTLTR